MTNHENLENTVKWTQFIDEKALDDGIPFGLFGMTWSSSQFDIKEESDFQTCLRLDKHYNLC